MKGAYEENPDTEIWQDFKQGREAAFTFMYSQYVGVLYNYGRHISSDEDLVKDCIQNLFVELWNNKDRLGDTNSIKYYLFTSLRRKIVDELMARRKHYTEDELSEEYSFELVLPYEANIITDQASLEQKKALLQAINTLTKRQKEALFLLYYDNLSYEEAASIMQLKIRTVYNLIHTAVEALRKNMRKIIIFLLIIPVL